MANSLGTNPIRLDTFGADVVISTKRIKVRSMVLAGYSSAKKAVFIDASAAVCLVAEVASDGHAEIQGPLTFSNGITFDDSESDFDTNDFILIYLD